MDDRVWDHSTLSENRDWLFNQDVVRLFFERVRALSEWSKLTSSEHFTVDGTLIDAWASHKSFVRRDDDTPSSGGGRNGKADFRGPSRSNATHVSRTDPEARLAGQLLLATATYNLIRIVTLGGWWKGAHV